MRFDHAIIAVHDLEAARTDYEALGFTTFYGGQHIGGKTHNALIVFADGSYLELLAPTDPALLSSPEALSEKYFLRMLVQGEGLAGFALHSDDLDADVAAMRQRGLAVSDPQPNGRLRADGQRIAWRSATLESGGMTPFFIADETPRVLRVPDDPEKVTHTNGATGMETILVGVHDFEAGNRRFQAILGSKPSVNRDALAAAFAIKPLTLVVLAPNEHRNDLISYLARRGEVPLSLSLHTADRSRLGTLDPEQAHGAKIQLVP